MRIVAAFPRPVREIEHCWIPLPDGSRLAARIWLPADAEASPVPAILEYIPYRKRDFTRARDEPMHPYFAGHGYAAVRVDVRGSGESDGVLADEYTEQELADGIAVIRWIATRPWCTGAVGMMGKSWGGFNALQIAAHRPSALKAIITVCASDDRYADDAHYMGGCLLNENLTWGAVLLTWSVLPPDPALVGERWRALWRERLERAVLFPEVWLRHQRRDAYWRRGSVGEDLARIECPVYAIGGWADAYTNAIPRLVAGLASAQKGLIGPWSHNYPHNGVPGPAIGFLQEALRWWDRWLKGIDTGITEEPAYRVWMDGRWVAEETWPSPRIASKRYALGPGRLLDEPRGPGVRLDWRSPQTVGLDAGEWCGVGLDGEAPGDQREDDAGSLVFDSEPLAERLEILGAPVAVLELAADRPQAFVAVRLCEVRPDGASVRVSYGVLNLAHRPRHKPGRRYTVRVQLGDVAHAFAAGNRIRLAISTSYWPIVWPSPEVVTLSVFTAASGLELPVRPPRAEDERLRAFEEAESGPPLAYTELRPARFERRVERDAVSGETVYTIASEGGGFGSAGRSRLEAVGFEVGHSMVRRYSIRADDPLSARAEVVQEVVLGQVRVETRLWMAATTEAFEVGGTVDAREGEQVVLSRRWDANVRRDGV